ncbi:MAG: hypothetical protein ABL974_08670 [Prosthecobacter sp.]
MLRALGCAAICGLSLSSCVVDPYGYPGGGYSGGGYSGGYYDDGDYGDGYYGSNYGAPLYTPAFTSLSFFGGSGWGNQCASPSYGNSRYYNNSAQYRGHSSYQRPVSSTQRYASQVTRPSTFRGNSVFSTPPPTPTFSAPRTLSRPTFSAPAPRPAPSAPSRSYQAPSAPAPSGRSERSSPIVQAASSFSAPAESGRFGGGLPSDQRRQR